MSKVDIEKHSVIGRIRYLQEQAEQLGYEHWSDVPEDETDALMRNLDDDLYEQEQ